MKSLQESLLDNDDKLFADTDSNSEDIQKIFIEQFLQDNYKKINGSYNIYFDKKSSLFIIDVNGDVTVKNTDIESLTNGKFKFGDVRGDFWCRNCNRLKSLAGAPQKVSGEFYCAGCSNIKDLNGGPEWVGGSYSIKKCTNLKSLKGIATMIKDDFNATNCTKLKDIKPMKKTQIWGIIYFINTNFSYDDVQSNLKNVNPNIFVDDEILDK